jgi:hypothetical protein
MKKDLTSRKLKTLKLSRETLGALNDSQLQAVVGEGTFRLCTDTCGGATCLC